MSRKRIFILTFLQLIALGSYQSADAKGANYCEYSYEFYKKYDALDDAVGKMVAPIIQNALSVASPKEALNVNGPCDARKVNVLIFNNRKVPDTEWLRLSGSKSILDKFVYSSTNNAHAIGNNLIVVDGQLIKDIAHLVFISSLYHVSLLDDLKEIMANSGNEFTAILEAARRDRVYGAVLDFGSLRYIGVGKKFYGDNNQNKKYTSDEAFSVVMSTDPGDPVLLPLSTLFLHEIAHLKSNTYGGFVDPLELVENGINAIRNYLSSLEEKNADDFANRMLPKVMSNYGRKAEIASAWALTKAEARMYMGFVRYMRDMLITDALRGFRGLNAEDVLVRFTYSDCPEKPEWVGSGGPDNLNTVYDGVHRFGNIITNEEFAQIRQRVYVATANKPHLNSILRGEAFFGVVDDGIGRMQQILGDEKTIYEAAYKNDPSYLSNLVIKPYEEDDEYTGLQYDRIRGILDRYFTFKDGVNCPVEFCLVGEFRSKDPGYIEILGPKNNIRKITTVFSIASPSLDGKSDNNTSGIDYIFDMLRLSGGWKGRDIPSKYHSKVLGFIEPMIENMKSCSTGTREITIGNVVVRMTTVNESGYVEMTVKGNSNAFPKAPKHDKSNRN